MRCQMDTDTVKKIQTRLNEVLGAFLVVDGDYGKKTKAAVKLFQVSRGLTADGVVGQITRKALFPEMPVEHISIITATRVKAYAPSALPSLVAAFDSMQAELAAGGLTTPQRVQHFMAQVAVETRGLSALEENLNYTAERLTEVWPSRFPSLAAAKPFAHNPEALANKTYGGRLGNTQPGDGWRYRGSGALQTTGRENFRKAGYEDNPEALRTPGPALKSALQYWKSHNINAAADADDIKLVRKIIQGGSEGLDTAKTWFSKAARIFV